MAVIDLAALTSTQGSIISGEAIFDNSGFSVSNAGDVNGDGYDDTIVGAPFADVLGKNNLGKSFVIFGSPTPLAAIDLSSLGTAGITISGEDAQDNSGWSVNAGGDVNGDGFDDIVVGASFADPSGKRGAGKSYVIFGMHNFPQSIDLRNLGAGGITISGEETWDRSGFSVSGAGDINGDGFDDIIVGAPYGRTLTRWTAGKSYIIFGSRSPANTIDLTILGAAGITILGEGFDDRSGSSVNSAGDVNGDGFDDLIVGAYNATTGVDVRAGRASLIFGSASPPSTIDLARLFISGITINGEANGDRTGITVNSAGDMNGDGYDDIVVRAGGSNASRKADAGKNYVIFGGPTLSSSIDLKSLGTAGITILGGATPDSGEDYVSTAGDLNGDGFDDLIIGAPFASTTGKVYAGKSYVVFGGPSLPSAIDLTVLGSAGITILGETKFNFSGRSVSTAGDVNGDGFDDLIIGAPDADSFGKGGAGKSYVIFGSDVTFAITHLGTQNADSLTGTKAADRMNGGRGNDILVGNGGFDVLTGGQGNDILAVSDLGFQRIVGGSGSDTLRLDGSGLSLNLTTLKDNRILGIETIDIAGSGNNTLTLSYRDVLNISDESNTLVVIRNPGDVVNLGDGWTRSGSELIGTTKFERYTQGATTVKLTLFNDDLANALPLKGATVSATGSNLGFTGEKNEPNHAGESGTLNSAWWEWTRPWFESGDFVTINTIGSNFDTTLAVYGGSSVGDLFLMASNDDIDPLNKQSQVSFIPNWGTTYLIVVDGHEAAVGDIRLYLTQANDAFANRYVLTGQSTSAFGKNVEFTGEANEPNHASGATELASAWWQWTAPISGTVTINTLESWFDTTLAAYTGSTVDALTLIAENDDISEGNLQSQISFFAAAGTNYSIAVDGYGGKVGGISLNLIQTIGPAVINRQVFYNRSNWQVMVDGTGNSRQSIDTSKTPLRPGQSASYDNYTNYNRGINGIVVDIAHQSGTPSAADFQFATWNGIDSTGFIATTAVPTITVIPLGGLRGTKRLKIEFPDNAIRNTWLRVTTLANTNTNLTAPDIFYFGNAVGDINVGNAGTPTNVVTNEADTAAVRQNLSTEYFSVAVTNIFDLNKDGRVNASDISLSIQNRSARSIRYFTAPTILRFAITPTSSVQLKTEEAAQAARLGNFSAQDRRPEASVYGSGVYTISPAVTSSFRSGSSVPVFSIASANSSRALGLAKHFNESSNKLLSPDWIQSIDSFFASGEFSK